MAAASGVVIGATSLAACAGTQGSPHRTGGATAPAAATAPAGTSGPTSPSGATSSTASPSATSSTSVATPPRSTGATRPAVSPTSTGATSTTGTANPSTAGTTGTGPVLIVHDANGTRTYDSRRPSTIDFSSDASNIVTHIDWTTWGPSTATGKGTLMLNTCKPNCAQGTVSPVPATITLSGVTGGHFTSMTELAGGTPKHFRYPSYWASGAS